MYGIWLDIRPTGGLTFRRMPGSMVHISTYPFLPPTTMSGWLRRLMMLQVGFYPETSVKDPQTYAMPPDCYVLGAYPVPRPERDEDVIHRTRRHGPMFQSKHVAFSRLYRNKKEEGNYEKLQLHTWEYLLVNRLRGYVLHEETGPLEAIRQLQNYGCKIGKEGYAYLEAVSPVTKLERVHIKAHPDTLVPGRALVGRPAHLYALYRYQYRPRLQLNTDLHRDTPSAIEGFVPFWVGWPDGPLELDYWTDGERYIPVALVEELYGD